MKLIKIALVFILLVGCSHQSNEVNDTSKITTTTPTTTVTTTTKPVVTTTTTQTPEVSYPKPEYHDQLMTGDFSAVAGEYINPEGKSITINNEGLAVDEFGLSDDSEYIDGDIEYDMYGYDGMYLASMRRKGDPESGCLLVVIPAGVKISYKGNVMFNTDTTKVRIFYSQGFPQEENEIYTKK